jgi:hypothetical protein
MITNNVITHVIVTGSTPDSFLWEFMQYSRDGNASIVPLASNLSIACWLIC